MIDVFLAWDTEDPIHPESDDAALRLCRLLDKHELRGCFFLVGEKARLLRERGRRDVLAALAQHEVDYHGNHWFEFPEPAMVYGDRLSWDDAVDEATRVELDGIHDVAEATGQWPSAWVQHQNNVSAPMPYAFRRLGINVWNGGFGSGPLVGWLMDQLIISRSAHVVSLQGSWAEHPTDPLAPAPPQRVMDPDAELRAFQERFDAVAAEHGRVVAMGHPTCWVMSEWWGRWDWHEMLRGGRADYPRGRRFRHAPRRSAADVDAHFEWTDRAFAWLAGRDDVHVTTFSEAHARCAETSPIWLTLEQVDTLAAACCDGPTDLALAGTSLSAADALGAFAALFCGIVRHGRVLDAVPVQRLLGPVEPPQPAAPVDLPMTAVWMLAGQLYDHAVTTGRVPGVLRALHDLGPAAMTMVLARAWRAWRETARWPDALAVTPPSDLPPAAEMPFFREPRASSSNAPSGFQPQRLIERVQWQSWSYRPAVEQG